MLKQLLIRNFAVIEELELQLHSGMTVFTGETGAGKSILVDALGLVLGDRADSGIIRDGCERTEISALFEVPENSDVHGILEEQDIGVDENGLLVRRAVGRDGRSRAYINGTAVPVNLLRSVGEHLIDIHGQHAHQSLMKKEAQRILLDDYGGYREELAKVNAACREWARLQEAISRLSGDSDDHRARQNLLQYQVEELESLAPEENEFESLSEEYRRLENASQLTETAQKALQVIREDEFSVIHMLSTSLRDLQDAEQYDGRLASAVELLDSASIQLSEAGDELRHYLERMDLDPERLQEVESRLSCFHDIARKHNVPSQGVFELLQDLKSQLCELLGNEDRLAELEEKQALCLEQYREASNILHKRRLKTAEQVSLKVGKSLESLGMPGSRFVVKVEKQESGKPVYHGDDQIEFLVSANPGQAPQALRKVASGGELSRISLAIQVISKNDKPVPTFVFDEVDAGIGGGIAEIVGKLLHSLTDRHQVFCVTHLAQVASLADHHLQVQKSSSRDSTQTAVLALNEEERIEEIARMLGGIQITEQTREHAKEMLLH